MVSYKDVHRWSKAPPSPASQSPAWYGSPPAPSTRSTPLAQRGDKCHRARSAEGPGLEPDLPPGLPPPLEPAPGAPRSGPAHPGLSRPVHQSPVVVIANDHNPHGETTETDSPPGSGGQNCRVEGPAGRAPSGGSEGGTFVPSAESRCSLAGGCVTPAPPRLPIASPLCICFQSSSVFLF